MRVTLYPYVTSIQSRSVGSLGCHRPTMSSVVRPADDKAPESGGSGSR